MLKCVTRLRATERHLPYALQYGITQCYLPPNTGERLSYNTADSVVRELWEDDVGYEIR